jgi:BirA family biotin operon repressor/biotin-[acetyl-CoA-carboxylase] ligase
VTSPGLPSDLDRATALASSRAVLPLQVHWAASLPSTMDAAADAVRDGAPEGYVVVADSQTAGRGRRGRSWESPSGAGLYLSVVLRPAAGDARTLSLLTLALGLGVRRAVREAAGIAPDLKWPNDLVIHGRKLAGILAEGHGLATGTQAVVAGIGINVRRAVLSHEVSARATSIEAEAGHAIARAPIFESVLVHISGVYDHLRRGGADDILREWRQASPSACGAEVEWETPEGLRHGVTGGIDRDGALVVDAGGTTERIVGGVARFI